MPVNHRPLTRDALDMVRRIQDAVCDHYRITRYDLLSEQKARRIIQPRQVAIYLARELSGLSYSTLKDEFARLDHSTISHACRVTRDLMDVYPDFRADVEFLRQQLLGTSKTRATNEHQRNLYIAE